MPPRHKIAKPCRLRPRLCHLTLLLAHTTSRFQNPFFDQLILACMIYDTAHLPRHQADRVQMRAWKGFRESADTMPSYAVARLSREPVLLNVFFPHLLNVLRNIARFRRAVITQSFQPARAPGERINLTQIAQTRIKARGSWHE